jgi:predicted negative regulator of RcsB-dependent stress response
MQDFETEEQQIEAIKGWWKENASSLLIGLAIGGFTLGGWNWYKETQYQHGVEAIGGFTLGGWNWYKETQYQHGVEASDMYVSVVTQSEKNTAELDSTVIDKLKAGYADTPYAALSVLVMAKHDVNAGNLEQAATHLKWVIDNAVEDEVSHIARLRLARLMIGQKNFDEANKLLSSNHPSAFDALYEELKGDMFVAMDELTQARIAYDKAISGSENPGRWLQLKRQDLGTTDFKKAELVEPPA